jgi:uncharacterized alpha-E superfamily protein
MGFGSIMISRIAGQSFWTFRYLERTELLARMLYSTHFVGFDNRNPSSNKELLLLDIVLERFLFTQLYPGRENDSEVIQHFLIWQELNPNSLFSSLKRARINARLIREIISEEMWLAINELHLWLGHENAQVLYEKNRLQFFSRIIESIQKLKGAFYNLLRRDNYFHMMELGLRLERASQVSNMLHRVATELIVTSKSPKSTEEQFGFFSILLSCFASTENFLRSGHEINSDSFVTFFLSDPFSPYSLTFCLENCKINILMIGHPEQNNSNSTYAQIQQLLSMISTIHAEKRSSPKLIEKIYRISIGLNAINASMQKYIFVEQTAMNNIALIS